MTLTLFILIFLAVVVLLALALALAVLRGMFIPTRGRKIGSYADPRKALLVLDVQESGNGPVRARSFEAMIATINGLIEQFARTGNEVTYIRQVFDSDFIVRLHGGRRLSGRLEPRLDRRLLVVNRNDFRKNRTDAFASKRLEQLLIDRQVDELFLAGVDAAFCVHYTALGGLNRGYRVTVVKDAVLSRRPMTEVLAKYERRGIGVITSKELLDLLPAGETLPPPGDSVA
jgi:nicotinamidase-related amidase